MDVSDVGRTNLSGVRLHHEMPMSYRLNRSNYDLYAEIHKDSIQPAAVFYVRGTEIKDPTIVGLPIVCNADFKPVRSSEAKKYGFPEDSYKFTWVPVRAPQCKDKLLPEGPSRLMTISVYDSQGNLMAVENLTFEIVKNGSRLEIDGL